MYVSLTCRYRYVKTKIDDDLVNCVRIIDAGQVGGLWESNLLRTRNRLYQRISGFQKIGMVELADYDLGRTSNNCEESVTK